MNQLKGVSGKNVPLLCKGVWQKHWCTDVEFSEWLMTGTKNIFVTF